MKKAEAPKVEKAPKAEPKAAAKAAAKAEKAPKAEKAKADKAPKEAKKAPKAKAAENAEEEPEEFEEEFPRQDGDKVVDAGDGHDYIQRGVILFNMEGRMVGKVVTGEDGDDEVEWTDGR